MSTDAAAAQADAVAQAVLSGEAIVRFEALATPGRSRWLAGHVMRVRSVLEPRVTEGRAWIAYPTVVYTLTCACGLTGPARSQYRHVVADGPAHLMDASPVPPDQRCVRPRAHGTREWEFCALCAGQADLFGGTPPAGGVRDGGAA